MNSWTVGRMSTSQQFGQIILITLSDAKTVSNGDCNGDTNPILNRTAIQYLCTTVRSTVSQYIITYDSRL